MAWKWVQRKRRELLARSRRRASSRTWDEGEKPSPRCRTATSASVSWREEMFLTNTGWKEEDEEGVDGVAGGGGEDDCCRADFRLRLPLGNPTRRVRSKPRFAGRKKRRGSRFVGVGDPTMAELRRRPPGVEKKLGCGGESGLIRKEPHWIWSMRKRMKGPSSVYSTPSIP